MSVVHTIKRFRTTTGVGSNPAFPLRPSSGPLSTGVRMRVMDKWTSCDGAVTLYSPEEQLQTHIINPHYQQFEKEKFGYIYQFVFTLFTL